ncbi:MAG: SDR family oxidoreductase [Saprospiraceae bacterium]
METKVVIVTGGAQGIGKVTAEILRENGWRVIVLEEDAEAMIEVQQEWQDTIELMRCDIANEGQVKSAIESIMQKYNKIDALINNAAVANNKSIEILTLDEWNRVINVNLTGAFLVAKYCTPHLRQAKGGIINIASTRAYMSEPNTEAYSASKGGILALTHALAISLGPDVRVNSISPGWIDVSGVKKVSERKPVELSEADHAQHPVGRVGKAEDIAALILFLLSAKAGFITGQDFVVDGGMTRKMIYV